jgi:hypothetical protein
MKLKNLCLTAVTSFSFLFTQCNKSSDASSQDYSPLTAGSSWTYTSSSGTSNKLTATNRDTVAAGHTYRVLTNSSGTNTYLGKSGNEYYRFGSFSSIGINNVEELYLKDNQDVNGTWKLDQAFNYPTIPFPLTATLNYTIKSKGGTRTVSGKTFNNVIQVRLDITVTGLGNIGGGDFYYASGVGMIENAIAINVVGQPPIAETNLLTAYEIK